MLGLIFNIICFVIVICVIIWLVQFVMQSMSLTKHDTEQDLKDLDVTEHKIVKVNKSDLSNAFDGKVKNALYNKQSNTDVLLKESAVKSPLKDVVVKSPLKDVVVKSPFNSEFAKDPNSKSQLISSKAVSSNTSALKSGIRVSKMKSSEDESIDNAALDSSLLNEGAGSAISSFADFPRLGYYQGKPGIGLVESNKEI